MSRPTTKPDLIKSANEQFEKLWKLIDSIRSEEQNTSFNFGGDFLQKQKEAHWARDKNLRDVLVHLYEWHILLLNWVKSNQSGDKKSFLPEPYNWKTYGRMNIDFWEKHQATLYGQARKALQVSHAEVIALIEACSNDELFVKNHFSWTGTSTLCAYCVSATSSHYDWAIKKVKQHIKTCGN